MNSGKMYYPKDNKRQMKKRNKKKRNKNKENKENNFSKQRKENHLKQKEEWNKKKKQRKISINHERNNKITNNSLFPKEVKATTTYLTMEKEKDIPVYNECVLEKLLKEEDLLKRINLMFTGKPLENGFSPLFEDWDKSLESSISCISHEEWTKIDNVETDSSFGSDSDCSLYSLDPKDVIGAIIYDKEDSIYITSN